MTARGEFPTSRSRSAFRIFRISTDSSGPASAFRHVACAAPEAVPHDPCFAHFAARAHTEELKHWRLHRHVYPSANLFAHRNGPSLRWERVAGNVGSWPKGEVTTASRNVRVREQSGKHML